MGIALPDKRRSIKATIRRHHGTVLKARRYCPHCRRYTKHAQADVFVFCLACSNPGVENG